jgi:hypothetical protein
MKRLPRDPLRFDIIDTFADFGQREKISLRDPKLTDGFVERTRASIDQSLSNERFLQGIRTERMFESLVASLGAVDILKQEDSGEIYVSDETLKVPDFRLVLKDGTQILVEVKNYYQKADAMQSFELDGDYLDGLVRYAIVMNTNLQLAIYWAKWNIWTLVRPESFTNDNEKRTLNMLKAMQVNHMAALGDYNIGTRFPLSLVMHADKTKPRAIGSDGSAMFTISSVELLCAGGSITDPREREIAMFLMFYGKWNYEVVPTLIGEDIEAVEHRWFPETDSEQGFEIVDSLSGMFSSFYRFATQEDEKIANLRVDITPGSWGTLIPGDYKGKALPLWRFILEPNYKSSS